VIYRLQCQEKTTISELAQTFSDKINPLVILPLIYQLIALGVFHADVNQATDSESEISFNPLSNQFDCIYVQVGEADAI
jgi:hypothetical protein